jgi:hypothetical protein
MVTFFKVNFYKIKETGKEFLNLLMVTFIKVSLNKIILMEKEFTNIKMVNYKMESGKITSLLANNE